MVGPNSCQKNYKFPAGFPFLFCSVNVCAKPLPEAQLQSTLENKGGLDVTDYGQFGNVMIGEKRELVFWIQ